MRARSRASSRRARRAGALAFAGSLLIGEPALAVKAVLWTETPAGLLRGDADSVSFTGDGAIVLAPRTESFSSSLSSSSPSKGDERPKEESAVSEPIVWCEALDADGNLILGTGHSGRVVRVTSRGDASTLAELAEPE